MVGLLGALVTVFCIPGDTGLQAPEKEEEEARAPYILHELALAVPFVVDISFKCTIYLFVFGCIQIFTISIFYTF